jgi:hypothetical protein
MSRKEPEIVVRINQLKELLTFFIGIFMPIAGLLGLKDKFETFTSLIFELCEKALPVTSRNSSKSPASDPNRKRVKRSNPAKRKPGGQ